MTETTTGLAAALAKAQVELLNTSKGSTADIKSQKGAFSYKFANIAAILSEVRPVLGKHGIAITQDVKSSEDGRVIFVTTHLRHGSEVLTFGPIGALPTGGNNPVQAVGSTITYLRRYSLEAAIGVAAESDDDDAGRGGSHDRRPPQRQQQRPSKPQDAPLRPAVFGRLKAALRGAFGESNGRDEAFDKADALAFDVCSTGIVDVMKDEKQAGLLLADMAGGR